MNPQQMQAYRQYPQAQRGTPAARRPQGESDSRTDTYHGSFVPPQRPSYGGPYPAKSKDVHIGQQLQMLSRNPYDLPNWHIPSFDHTDTIKPRRSKMYCDSYTQVPYTIVPQLPTKVVPYNHRSAGALRQPPQQSSFLSSSSNHVQTQAQAPYMIPYLPIVSGQVPNPAQHYAQQQAALQQQRQQQQNAVLEHQMAQRRAKRPTDRNMPDGVEDMVIGDGVQQYKELREQERRLDYAIARKRLDLTDTFNRTSKRPGTLRIWVSNTANNQPWQQGALEGDAFDFQSTGDSTARIKIQGRLLEDPEDDAMGSENEDDDQEDGTDQKTSKPPTQKMTHFFKSMSVEFDKNRNNVPDPGWQVEWQKQPKSNDLDYIEFQRKCDENINITINLTRDEAPERYRLSSILASTLDMEEGDRAEVVMAIWEYVKLFNLLEDEDKRSVRCDDQLRQIFGAEQIYFPQIPDRIMPHLHPLPPVKLPYTVRVDQEFLTNPEPTVYDIRVLLEDPLKARIAAITQNPDNVTRNRQIAQIDEQLAVVIQALQHSKARHIFFKSMAKDPAGFVNRWVGSQRRDLEVILGEAGRGGGEDGSGPEFTRGGKDGVWGSEPVAEAVRYMLAKPQAPKV